MTSLWVNVVHGFVAWIWAVGTRHLLAPGCPAHATTLASLCLVLPLVVPILTAAAAGIWPVALEAGPVLRVGAAYEVVARVAPPATFVLWTLLGGTTVLFVVQEAIRILPGRRVWRRWPTREDAALEALVAGLTAKYRDAGLLSRRTPAPRVLRVEGPRPLAMMRGLRRPTLLLSDGLIASLDAEQLEAVVAHELAHLVHGGNLRLMFLWLLRAVQAPSPGALIAFRSLTVTLEGACDAAAVRVTGRPAALASALMKVYRAQHPQPVPVAADAHAPARATAARGDRALVEQRVRALLAEPCAPRTPRATTAAATLLLAVLLWSIR
ncbi:M56 family metallopeptidase [Myxococcota bacterium]|nr:M56 family metallopeptidase [Myxococcota bacterium]